MVTSTQRVYFTVNENGNAQNPSSTPQIGLYKPDGTVHTAIGNVTQDSGIGDGFYYRDFTINDASDSSGVYSAVIQVTTDGGLTPVNVIQVTVRIE